MKLYEIVASILKIDPRALSPESNAQNTPNWDSLNHIELIFAIESAFHVRFSMPEIAGLRKLGDIERLLETKSVTASTESARKIA